MSVMRPHRGQFVVVPTFVLDHETISDGALRLYAVMADYTDPDGRCWAARSTLAERMHCSLDTVDRRVRELEEIGLLRHERRIDSAGDPTSNLWTLVIHRRQRGRGSRTDAATGSRTDAAQNQTHSEPDSASRKSAAARSPRNGSQPQGVNEPFTDEDGSTFLPGTGWVR